MLSCEGATRNASTPQICLMEGGKITNYFAFGTVTVPNLENICPVSKHEGFHFCDQLESYRCTRPCVLNTSTNNRGSFSEKLRYIKVEHI